MKTNDEARHPVPTTDKSFKFKTENLFNSTPTEERGLIVKAPVFSTANPFKNVQTPVFAQGKSLFNLPTLAPATDLSTSM